MSRRFLLDTHVVVDIALSGGIESTPLKVRRILEDPDVELLLCVASSVEIAIKNKIGKLNLSRDSLTAICTSAGIVSYPLRQTHAERLFDLPPHHTDPFDRLIISTALCDEIPVISSDREFRKYKGLRVIW